MKFSVNIPYDKYCLLQTTKELIMENIFKSSESSLNQPTKSIFKDPLILLKDGIKRIGVCVLWMIFSFFPFSASAEIQFFIKKGCPFCQAAQEYLQTNFPDKKITPLDISDKNNHKKFTRCAERFKLDKEKLGTPLFCTKKAYIMGWGPNSKQKLERILSP